MVRLVRIVWLLALFALGCKDEPKPADAAPTPEIVAAGPLAALEAPPGVMAFGAVDRAALDRLGSSLGGSAPGVVPTAENLAKTVQQMLRLSDASVLDLGKPVRFVLLDPKKHSIPVLVAVATTGKDKLIAALPADKRAGDGGNAFSYEVEGRPLYLSFVDDHLVLSYSQPAFAEQRELVKKLLGTTLDAEAVLAVSVKNARVLYGIELDAALVVAKRELEKSAELPAPTQKQLGRALDGLAAAISDVDKLIVRASVPSQALRLELEVQARPESQLAAAFAGLSGGPLPVLAKLPPETPLCFAMRVDPAGTGAGRTMLRASMELALGGLEVGESYRQALEQFWLASEGQMVFAAHPLAGREALAFSGLVPLKDGAKARAAMDALQQMYADAELKKNFAAAGLDVSLQKAAYRIGEVPVDVVVAKPTKPLAERPFAELLDTHQAIGPDLVLFAHGKDAKATLEAWLGGKVPGGFDKTPGHARAMQTAAPAPFALLYLSPGELLRRMLPGRLGTAAPLPAQSGLTLTAGSRAGALVLAADLPAEQALALAQFALHAPH